MRPVPPESFTVVMATGIVAVAARDDGLPVLAAALALLAGIGLVVILGWMTAVGTRARHGIAAGTPIDRLCGQFGVVAALDVVAAQLGSSAWGLVTVLGAAALTAWFGLTARLVTVVHAAGAATVCAGARSSWLLVAVATQSLALIAARLRAAGPAAGTLVAASLLLWAVGLLVYVVIAALVARRLLATRLAPRALTPDIWILMGALAIAVVAGGTLVDTVHATGMSTGLATVVTAVVICCWLAASAWIPVLIAAEVRRARRPVPGYEPSRWSTVFPVGMYGVACAVLATLAPAARTGLEVASVAMFWTALAAWCATAIGAIAHHVRGRAAM